MTERARVATVGLLILIGYLAFQHAANAGTQQVTPTKSPPPKDPVPTITFSSFATRTSGGITRCFRVDLYSDGTSSSTEVEQALCCDDNPQLPGC